MATSKKDKPLSRDNFDIHWLENVSPSNYKKLSHKPLQEKQDSRKIATPFISQAIVDHHLNQKRVADWLNALGHKKTASEIAANLPKDDRTRKGNFGEVIASEHLIQRYGYYMPIFKLRYRDSHNMPMRGEDIVAFVLTPQGEISKICIGESKTRKKFSSSTVLQAHDRLKNSYHPCPETLSMLANIAYEIGNIKLGSEIDRVSRLLAEKDFPTENWVFLITEDKPSEPFAEIEKLGNIIKPLICVDLQLSDLQVFVDGLFDNPEPFKDGVKNVKTRP
jgi:hypothetical protein